MRGFRPVAGVTLFLQLSYVHSQELNLNCNVPATSSSEFEVDAGLHGTYHFNVVPSVDAQIGYMSTASANNCIRECAARTDGAKCTWWQGYCVFYHPTATLEPLDGSIYVTYRKTHETNDHPVDQLSQDLANCRTHNLALEDAAIEYLSERDQSQSERDRCTIDLAACESQLSAAQVPVRCNEDDGKTTSVRGKLWKLHCREDAGCLQGPHNIGNKDTLEACVEECAGRADCTFLSYKPSTKACWASQSDQQYSTCSKSYDANYHTVELLD
ncbi:hypothetical protein N7455_007772 [Penicillium solitum]|uniref:uncharacterized protein n=1 Tax=Penicillium solitum TaxID=60172 RepID=UPI0017EF0DF4|nr:hypothetical protein HAV15_004238 [Penicillium sp. str. \